MHRKSLIACLFVLYVVAAVAIGSWSLSGLMGVSGTVFAQVKGAASDGVLLTQAPPSLEAYASAPSRKTPEIPALQFALYAPQSGQVIVSSKQLQSIPIASTTKLMTSHLVSKYGKLEDSTTVSTTAASINGSLSNLQAGETISVKNLLYCLLLVSGNDAAHALAEYVGGVLLGSQSLADDAKTTRFVQAMNDEAALLHLDHTHYLDPAGLDDEGHSNAVDLAKVASLDIADRKLQPIMDTADNTVTDTSGAITHVLHNSDRLVSEYQYAGSLGGKTGFTPAAGHCLMSSAKRDGHTLIAVILNTYSYTNDASALATKKLLDWGFENVSWQ